jgi:hypothetical protein
MDFCKSDYHKVLSAYAGSRAAIYNLHQRGDFIVWIQPD